jgi:hypothetical protein
MTTLPAYVSRLSRKYGILDVSQSYMPVTGIFLLFFIFLIFILFIYIFIYKILYIYLYMIFLRGEINFVRNIV